MRFSRKSIPPVVGKTWKGREYASRRLAHEARRNEIRRAENIARRAARRPDGFEVFRAVRP